MPNPGIFAHYDSEGKLILDPQEDIRLTAAQVQAVQDLVSGPQGRSAAPASISLPSHITAAWWPLNDGTGTAPVDAVNGLVAEAVGTTTQLWDNAGYATLAADTAIRIRNNSAIDELMRLDTLNGSLIVGIEIVGSSPSGSSQAWGYGDNGQTATGGFTGSLNASNYPSVWYCPIGGPTNQTLANNLAALLKAKNRKFWHWVIHRFDDRIYVDGYESGFHSRSSRIPLLDGFAPTEASNRGLRIGARPSGASGGSAQYVGAVFTLPQIANWHAIRVAGDYRHRIPGWINNIVATMPYGCVPEVLNHG